MQKVITLSLVIGLIVGSLIVNEWLTLHDRIKHLEKLRDDHLVATFLQGRAIQDLDRRLEILELRHGKEEVTKKQVPSRPVR